MIGTLYRYPHPIDPCKFIYSGQGSTRDNEHRQGRTSFGRRFKNKYPGISLPKPIKEEIKICDKEELNAIETIWMFRYHTWKGYPDGMNLTFPGTTDYKNMGKIGGTVTSSVPGRMSAAGKIGGKTLGKMGGLIGGRVTASVPGRMSAWGKLSCSNRNMSEVGKIGGHKTWHVMRNIISPKCKLCLQSIKA